MSATRWISRHSGQPTLKRREFEAEVVELRTNEHSRNGGGTNDVISNARLLAELARAHSKYSVTCWNVSLPLAMARRPSSRNWFPMSLMPKWSVYSHRSRSLGRRGRWNMRLRLSNCSSGLNISIGSEKPPLGLPAVWPILSKSEKDHTSKNTSRAPFARRDSANPSKTKMRCLR